jgi:outer membrane protein OmpA-like peptidoglycan-associated protein
MPPYETFRSNAAEFPLMRKWLLRALVLSLLIHVGLLVFFNLKRLENFGYTATERLAPPPFKVRQVKISNVQDEAAKTEQPSNKPLPPIKIPETKPQVDEIVVSPANPKDMSSPLVPAKVDIKLSGFDALEKNAGNSLAAMEKQLEGQTGGMLDKMAAPSKNQPRILLPNRKEHGDGGVGAAGGVPGRTTIEQALEQAGRVNNKPIAMQGGALFEWGKAELLPEAIQNLQKLAELIRRNPKSTFIISGHTDHTGSHETNLALSQQRADSVRDWLVANLGIDPMRITTIGKADDEAFPELGPNKSIEEQAPNRRVEIVIKTRGK